MSMTGELLKNRRLERQNKNKMHSKRRETEILAELKALLEEHLKDNDSVMIEIDPRFLSEFLNIIDTITNILTETIYCIFIRNFEITVIVKC